MECQRGSGWGTRIRGPNGFVRECESEVDVSCMYDDDVDKNCAREKKRYMRRTGLIGMGGKRGKRGRIDPEKQPKLRS